MYQIPAPFVQSWRGALGVKYLSLHLLTQVMLGSRGQYIGLHLTPLSNVELLPLFFGDCYLIFFISE